MFFNTNYFKYFYLYLVTKKYNDKKIIKQYELTRDVPFNSSVCIYGFGPYGRDVFRKIFFHSKITGVFDITLCDYFKSVLIPNNICDINFDYIIVTVMNERGRLKVLKMLENNGISSEKIVLLNYVNE